MRTMILALNIYESKVGTDRFNILANACPELVDPISAQGDRRKIEVHDVDEQYPPLQRLLKMLPQMGLHLEVCYTGKPRNSDIVSARRERQYDTADFEQCELVWIDAKTVSGGVSSADERVCFISEYEPEHNKDLRHVSDFACVGYKPICSNSVRRVLEASNLVGLHFRETLLEPRDLKDLAAKAWTPWEKFGEPWWRIEGTVRLPPLAPSVKKIDTGNNNAVMPRETERGFTCVDDPEYSDFEFHYLRSELEALGRFDVASMHEWYPHSYIIVSKRFYNIVREH